MGFDYIKVTQLSSPDYALNNVTFQMVSEEEAQVNPVSGPMLGSMHWGWSRPCTIS